MKRILIILGAAIMSARITASADIIDVPGDYPTVQQGIDACSAYDTVMVADGIYNENLDISVPICLFGQSRDNTIIDASSAGDVVFIDIDDVFVRNFTIRNSGLEDAGIEISFADSCLVDLCRLEDNYSGIDLYGSSFNTIRRSIFSSNQDGILFREDYSAPTGDNFQNVIRNNIIENNLNFGIDFAHTGATYHSHNVIKGNRIVSNVIGISTIVSQENEISCNEIIGNSGYGAAHAMCMGGGELNEFHHNNFLGNNGDSVQASDTGGGQDRWYSILDAHGNHWSDYTGQDADGDGIGDTPYYIDGGESQDIFPLMAFLTSTIHGTVSDSLLPIAGVHVSAVGTGIDAYTDENGQFMLAGLGAGMYDVSFSHPSYEELTRFGISATLSETTEITIVLDPLLGTDDDHPASPYKFALLGNYPNPFNTRTTIKYTLPYSAYTTISIFDLLGRCIATPVAEDQDSGLHTVTWQADDNSTGIYFATLENDGRSQSIKMILLK